MSSWTSQYPKKVSKNDLRGKPLHIYDDIPPEPSNIKGMILLIIGHTDRKGHNEKYKILCTDQDIQKIIDIVSQNETFTFDKTEPYADVVRYVPGVTSETP